MAEGRVNPFAGKKGKPSIRSEVWEVLYDHPAGLSQEEILEQMKIRNIKVPAAKDQLKSVRCNQLPRLSHCMHVFT